jgi:hypothetical protein
MKYFNNFPRVGYRFGDEVKSVTFPNLSVYVDVFDQVKERVSDYRYYTILDGDRPDSLSYKLYGTPDYHWTFFYMNDHLKESGWPLDYQLARTKAMANYPDWAVRTATPLHIAGDHIFVVGTEVTGTLSGSVGTIVRRNLDLGQLIIEGPDNFNVGEQLKYTGTDDIDYYCTVYAQGYEYNGIHHLEDASGNWVDINPALQNTSGKTIVTYLEQYLNVNESHKQIKVIRPEIISSLVGVFKQYLK